MSRVRSFAVAFNYLILNYLRLNYLRLNYLRLIYAQFLRHFLTAILLFLVLGCIIIIIIIVIIIDLITIKLSHQKTGKARTILRYVIHCPTKRQSEDRFRLDYACIISFRVRHAMIAGQVGLGKFDQV